MSDRLQGRSIVCAGDITPDIIIPYQETLDALSRIREGEVVTSNPTLRPGGAVANTVATLGKLGMRPYMLSAVGSDEYGDYLIDYLKSCGVRVDYISKQPERMSLILAVLGDEERVIYLYNGPGAKLPELTRDRLPDALIPKIGWIHANGFVNDETVDYMARCKAAGATVSFDLNLRVETFGFDDARRARIGRAIAVSDVLIGSGAEEFAPITGHSDLYEAGRSLDDGSRIVVVRDGHNPVQLFERGNYYSVPVEKAAVVNKVGGGDAFNGGFIAAYAKGYSAIEAVRWGCCCAVWAISSHQPHNAPPLEVLEALCN